MYITSVPLAIDRGLVERDQDGLRYLLVGQDVCDAEGGSVSLLVLPAGSRRVVPTGGRESGSVLLSGEAVLPDGRSVGSGAVFQSGPGDSVALRTTQHGLSLLTLQGRPMDRSDTTARTFAIDDVPDVPAHNPAAGFHHMRARMLVDADSGGRRSFTLGMGTFAPGGGRHALHRHAHAEEVFYVWEGAGVHLSGDGNEHPLSAGDLVFVPRDEWHGFKNTGNVLVRAFFGYLGVGARSDAGYELMTAPDLANYDRR